MGIGRGRGVPRQPIVRRRPESPRRPIEPPFPQYAGLRLGQYTVQEERDNYVICRGFDPNAKHPAAEITPTAYRTINVAKPPTLQRTAWEGDSFEIDGITYTFTYSDDEYGVRTANWTDKNGNNQNEEQRIDQPYRVDDLITAVEIRKSAGPVEGMEVEDEDGTRLRWLDLNVAGRHWKTTTPRYAKLTATLDKATSFLAGEKYAAAVFVKENPASPGNLIADTVTFTVVNRWVDLSLNSGKYLIVEKIGDEWVIVASECP